MYIRYLCLLAALSTVAVGRPVLDLDELGVEALSPSVKPEVRKSSVIDTATLVSLNLVQIEALHLATTRARAREALAVDEEDNLTSHARVAAAASMDAAQRAAEATVAVMNRNRELELENQKLREARAISKSSVASVMVRAVARSVPQHRFQQYNLIAMDVNYSAASEEILGFPKRRPWTTNLVIAPLKCFFADLIVQATSRTDESGSSKYDWKRSVLFTIFGFFYVGIVQWFFYVSIFSTILPESTSFADEPFEKKLEDRIGQEDLLIQVIADQLFIMPFVYFPIFYVLKEVLHQHHRDDETHAPKSRLPLLGCAVMNYVRNFWQDNLASVAIWFPADFVIFMAPMYLRMPLDHGVAFLWTMILSYMRGVAK